MHTMIALVLLLGLQQGLADDCFTKPIGISDQAIIPDLSMTASSQYGSGYQPAFGRLNGDRGDGWCAKSAIQTDDWLQADLGTATMVCGIASQGDRDGNEWVTAFKLSNSSDGNVWTPYKDVNNTEVEFQRQGESNTVDRHQLPVPVTARFFRFHPTKQHAWNCLRVELYGDKKPAVNGGWSKWSKWGPCNKSCSGGEKTKSRQCDNPAPANDGNKCKGKETRTKKCKRKTSCYVKP